MSIIKDLYCREIDNTFGSKLINKHQFSSYVIRNLFLKEKLEGHEGCVNCIEFNESGSLLASGSDDLNLIIWDPLKQKKVNQIRTPHRGNIFSANFIPHTNDAIVATCAADRDIFLFDINKSSVLHGLHTHLNRVKRLTTSLDVPYLFWSCGEDGMVLQHDIRSAKSSQMLLNFTKYNYNKAENLETKCVAINPTNSNLMAVGGTDPFARVYDRRMLKYRSISNRNDTDASSTDSTDRRLFEYCLIDDSVLDPPLTYYVPGHLPSRIEEYRKRMRTLSVTFLVFSPDGSELLVNLGGEQLYLFGMNTFDSVKFKYNSYSQLFAEELAELSKNYPSTVQSSDEPKLETKEVVTERQNNKKKTKLPLKAEELKAKANTCFESQKYMEAIEYYNLAIQIAPDSPILYANRAAALLKRNWDGDVYQGLQDCYKSLSLDKTHLKSHFRLSKCLNDLKWSEEAKQCVDLFCRRFPDYANSQACENLVKEIDKALETKRKNQERSKKTESSESKKETEEEDENNSSESEESDTNESKEHEDSYESNRKKKRCNSKSIKSSIRMEQIKNYKKARENAVDYKARYCGHCNVATDIKEANFIGENFIAAGSDDGSFFIWDKTSTNIVRVLKGDESIVNCIQTHPILPIVATSGIDSDVKLWEPKIEHELEKDEERIVVDYKTAALGNQRQMNSHPFEYLFLNLNQNVQNWEGEGGEEDQQQPTVGCRTS